MNHHYQDDSLFEQIHWAEAYGAFNNPVGKSVLRACKLGIVDPVVERLAHDIIRPYQKRQAFGELPPFKASCLQSGPFVLGKGIYDEPIQFNPQWLTSGLLLVANTGGGKSNLLSLLLLLIAASGYPFWTSDLYKRQLRRLRHLLRPLGIELIIFRCKDWRWNLLQSHLRDPKAHLTTAMDLLIRVLYLSPRARSIFSQAGFELYRQFGIWEGNTQTWPTLFDLYAWVKQTAGLNAAARDAILDRLGSLLIALGRCAAYRRGWNPIDLARHSIVFELQGTTETVKQILLESSLFTVFQHEVEKGVANGPLKQVIAFEDGQRFFEISQQSIGGEIAPMDELAGIIRGTGISLWVILQTAIGLSRRLLPNLAIKIIGRLGCHEDYASLGADLGMNTPQIQWTKLNIKPGMFIGQVSEGECHEPFVFTVPLVNMPDAVSDDEAAESVKILDALPTEPAPEFFHWEPHPVLEVEPQTEPATRLSELELRYLKAVIQQPGQSASFYSKAAGLNGQRAAEVRERLVAGGYVREYSVATAARGRNAILLEPLPPAYEEVENL